MYLHPVLTLLFILRHSIFICIVFRCICFPPNFNGKDQGITCTHNLTLVEKSFVVCTQIQVTGLRKARYHVNEPVCSDYLNGSTYPSISHICESSYFYFGVPSGLSKQNWEMAFSSGNVLLIKALRISRDSSLETRVSILYVLKPLQAIQSRLRLLWGDDHRHPRFPRRSLIYIFSPEQVLPLSPH